MKGALARGEFFLQFQPIVELATGRIRGQRGAGALAASGARPRAAVAFVPVAEQSSAIHESANGSCTRPAARRANGPTTCASPSTCRPTRSAIVPSSPLSKARCARRNSRPQRLHVEVTRSAALGSALGTAAALDQLHEIGAAIVLDDFGTGFSSFDHIRPAGQPAEDRPVLRRRAAGAQEPWRSCSPSRISPACWKSR